MTSPFANKALVIKTFDQASAPSNVAIWTPASGNRVIVFGFVFFAASAGDVDIYVGTDAAGSQLIKGLQVTNTLLVGPITYPSEHPYRGAEDEVVKITAAGGISGAIWGCEERA